MALAARRQTAQHAHDGQWSLELESLEDRILLNGTPELVIPAGGPTNVDEIVQVGDLIFFEATDPTNGSELWKSDGTAGGTVLVKDTSTGTDSSCPGYLTNVNGRELYKLETFIDFAGTTATVRGTAGDDVFEFRTVGDRHFVTLNGEECSFPVANVARIDFDGLGGNDSIKVTGTAADETAILRNGNGNVTRTVATLSGSTFLNQVRKFDTVVAHASTGNDSADFFDSVGNDRYTGRPGIASMTGPGFNNQARGFDSTTGRSSRGNDLALLHDSSGNDSLTGDVNSTTFSGSGFSNRAFGFASVIAIATTGRDTAKLIDSSRNDVLIARKPFSKLTGPGYAIEVRNFDAMHATARNGGNDRATLRDTSGNDNYTGRGTTGELTGSGYANKHTGFDRVDAFATGGTNRLNVNNLSYIFRDIGRWTEV